MKPAAAVSLMVLSFVLLSAGVPTSPLAAKKQAQEHNNNDKLVECTMNFDLKSWSALYKSSKGDGTIHCDNGQTAKVLIKAKGGGITFGKSEVINGTGNFTGVRRMNEVFDRMPSPKSTPARASRPPRRRSRRERSRWRSTARAMASTSASPSESSP